MEIRKQDTSRGRSPVGLWVSETTAGIPAPGFGLFQRPDAQTMKEDVSGPRTESASHMENIKVRISEETIPLPQFILFNQRSQSVEKLDIFEFSVYPKKISDGQSGGAPRHGHGSR